MRFALLLLLMCISGMAAAIEPAPPWANAPYYYPSHKRIGFDGEALGECLAVVTAAEFKKPVYSKSFMNCVYGWDDFMDGYLIASPRRKCDYASGKEADLKTWVLQQPENSIDPVKIYRESLRLNQGNVWNAVLTIHQLLRLNARWWAGRFYRYASTDKDQTIFFNKFIDIRGDLRERGTDPTTKEPFTGDHSGSWYRIWGMMLYRLALVDEADWEKYVETPGAQSLACKREFLDAEDTVAQLWKDFRGVSVATMAEWYKVVAMEPEDDWRKGEINRAASATMGVFIDRLLTRNTWRSVSACEHPSTYLRNLD